MRAPQEIKRGPIGNASSRIGIGSWGAEDKQAKANKPSQVHIKLYALSETRASGCFIVPAGWEWKPLLHRHLTDPDRFHVDYRRLFDDHHEGPRPSASGCMIRYE